jgi:putative transposase
MAEWAKQHAVELEFIQPGKPTQNSYIERFNRTYRTEVLNMYAFRNLTEVKEITEAWIKEYNEERPHQALNSMSPVQYRLRKHPETSNLAWH